MATNENGKDHPRETIVCGLIMEVLITHWDMFCQAWISLGFKQKGKLSQTHATIADCSWLSNDNDSEFL